MLRRPLTSIEIKADDIDHMERVLLEAYQKKGATKTSVESDPSSASFGTPANEGKRLSSPIDAFSSSMDTSGNQTLPTLLSPGNGQPMEKYGYSQPKLARGKRIVFKDDDEDEGMDISRQEKEKASQGHKTLKRKEYHKDAKLKSWRLIIRNLPFKTTREDMQSACSAFGSFTDIVVPASKKIPGRAAGFAFIQFKTRESAEKAREFFNSNKFKGRMVAADWALPKDTYETAAREEREQLNKKVKLEEENVPKGDKAKISRASRKDEQPSASRQLNNNEEEEDVLSDGGSSDGSSDQESNVAAEHTEMGLVEEDHSEVDEEDKPRRKDSAVDEQRVVFLRNLSFDTSNETLKTEMEKFGEVELAICCKFRDSGHPKDGREIKGSIAIQRESAAEIQKKKSLKVPEDKRNLRLIRFSLIREGTSAANGMSSEDAAKRQRLAELSRKKLENLHMFVSPTRLMLHNLPSSVTDDKLRQICREAAGKLSHITECRIWRDTSKLDAKGNPRSKGFAFVNFSEHKDALQCLQKLNNNPHTFTNERRPIVEFSIENLMAIRAKVRRSAHSKGEALVGRELSDKVKQQVKKSIGEVHESGMKVMPKFLGKKLRHKSMSKTQLKKKNLGRKKVRKQDSLASDVTVKKSKDKSKKQMTKYLALSS
ncbi:hypothetical protein OSTOST_00984 [Ostertagia ostertagi]